ncbi:MAG: UDP-N-acetylglucosamine 2-epimerase (non-hydrolyzing) [Gammaproteobacteria bacterium]
MYKVVTIIGARPQFIKSAAVSKAFLERQDIEEILVHTGQHYDKDMSDIFFNELNIPEPKYNLGINQGTHGEMTGKMLESIEKVLVKESPNMVIIYGDTDSTLAGALAAAKLMIPIAHVEAGLRSYNRNMPEEINRVLSDHVSNLLLCPTNAAVKNLEKEGVANGVHQVGDVMYDVALLMKKLAPSKSNILESIAVSRKQYAVATIHRQENTSSIDTLAKILDYLRTQKHQIIFPLHPRTRKVIETHNLNLDGLTVINPLGYLDMSVLLANAQSIYTDSGGVQKEAYFYRVPCVTIRSETEWVETIDSGWNRLWVDDEYLPRKDISEYGSGDAANAIVNILAEHMNIH